MDRKKLKAAVDEAKRFIEKAKLLPEPVHYTSEHLKGIMHDNFPKQQGAIKRASMDLTRALADLRKP